jgi:acyl-CoA synthetase (NDP forming)
MDRPLTVTDIVAALRPLFRPRHVAIIGASQTRGKLGHAVVENLLRGGFPGRISPINPAGGNILGLPCYSALADVCEPVDCAMIVVPARAAVDAVRDCAAFGVRIVVVGASGFSETGTAAGRRWQAELTAIARARDMRLVGPNTNGIYNATDRLSLGYNAEHGEPIAPGDISIVSHSGALFGGVARNLRRLGAGLAKFVPVGNEADLDMLDFLDYLIADPATRVIGLIVEALSSGARLRALALRAHRAGKPIVAVKIGRSAIGAGAALAHSSRLAGEARAYDALFRECGIATVRAVEALAGGCAVIAAAGSHAAQTDRRLIAITTSGAGGGLLADFAAERGIPMAGDTEGEWQGKAGSAIAALPSSGHLRNPFDLGSLAGDWSRVGDALLALEQDGLDGPIAAYAHIAPRGGLDESLVACLAARGERSAAPVVVIAPGGLTPTIEAAYIAKGVPVFHDIGSGMDSLACHYARLRPPAAIAANAESVERIAATHADVLTELESASVLRRAGIPMVQSQAAGSPDEAERVAARLGYPVVLKAIAGDITHKRDAGMVVTGICDAAALRHNYAALERVLIELGYARDAVPFVIQPMIPAKAELIVGVAEEAQLGHFLIFGLGGVHTEILGRADLLHLPLDAETIRTRIVESIAGRIVAKDGGEPALRSALDILMALQNFVLAHASEISSIDINPLLLTDGGFMAVDGLIVLKRGTGKMP